MSVKLCLSKLKNQRRVIGTIIPIAVVQVAWWAYMFSNTSLLGTIFLESVGDYGLPRYIMSIVMVFGSMIAGATSEGGASVAFPVMTLALNINPVTARDFSLMIQTVGMTAAAITILSIDVPLERNTIVWVSVGGSFGIIVGLECIAPLLPPAFAKMYFVVIWAAFALSLYFLNINRHRHVYDSIQDWNCNFRENWRRPAILLTGFIGGILSSISGSGIDICSFAVITLLFRVSEKVATPTSVVIMAVNTSIGFFWRACIQQQIEVEAWKYFAVCIPVVVFGAPIGSVISSYLDRLCLARLIYILDSMQLVIADAIIRPWSSLYLSLSSIFIFFLFAYLFFWLSSAGLKLMKSFPKIKENNVVNNEMVVISKQSESPHPTVNTI